MDRGIIFTGDTADPDQAEAGTHALALDDTHDGRVIAFVTAPLEARGADVLEMSPLALLDEAAMFELHTWVSGWLAERHGSDTWHAEREAQR